VVGIKDCLLLLRVHSYPLASTEDGLLILFYQAAEGIDVAGQAQQLFLEGKVFLEKYNYRIESLFHLRIIHIAIKGMAETRQYQKPMRYTIFG